MPVPDTSLINQELANACLQNEIGEKELDFRRIVENVEKRILKGNRAMKPVPSSVFRNRITKLRQKKNHGEVL